ncbi:MAG: hypothetical protein JJU02_04975 [Cryomorphaceae bacterium]|nr:hypothetical protein [Cryomorphaceae bacterium]
MQSVEEMLEQHLVLLKDKMEACQHLMQDNLQLHRQLQVEREKNAKLQEEISALRRADSVGSRAAVLSNANRQTKAWIDRLVQEIDTCLETLNR